MKASAFIVYQFAGTFGVVREMSCGKPHPSEDSEALPKLARFDSVLLPPSEGGCAALTQHPKRWFAVYTTARHEKRVALHLNQRRIEHFLPVFRSQRTWNDGSRVSLELPLFPGYIFVRINRADRVRVLEVPGALNVIGGAGRLLAPLPDEEIEALRSGIHLRNAEPHPLLKIGERARIRSGALSGMEGIVVRKRNSLRVVLTLDLIMQSISVEVDGEDLEPLDS